MLSYVQEHNLQGVVVEHLQDVGAYLIGNDVKSHAIRFRKHLFRIGIYTVTTRKLLHIGQRSMQYVSFN